jgi:hypothetical protein
MVSSRGKRAMRDIEKEEEELTKRMALEVKKFRAWIQESFGAFNELEVKLLFSYYLEELVHLCRSEIESRITTRMKLTLTPKTQIEKKLRKLETSAKFAAHEALKGPLQKELTESLKLEKESE